MTMTKKGHHQLLRMMTIMRSSVFYEENNRVKPSVDATSDTSPSDATAYYTAVITVVVSLNTRTVEKKKSRTAEEGKFTLYLYIRFYTR